MMPISSIKAVKHFYNFFVIKKFLWSEFTFPSTLQLSNHIEILLEPLGRTEAAQTIQLGLHEALVNAVQHGNSGDPNKLLRVRRILTPNWFILQIQDEGSGISIHERTDCLPSEIDANSGRGLFLIHHCFDDVRWSRRGNRLQLAYRRSIEN